MLSDNFSGIIIPSELLASDANQSDHMVGDITDNQQDAISEEIKDSDEEFDLEGILDEGDIPKRKSSHLSSEKKQQKTKDPKSLFINDVFMVEFKEQK